MKPQNPTSLENPGLDPADVCTLPPDAITERLAWIRTEIIPHALHSERLSNGVALELDNAPGVSEKLDRLVELERDCCSGIDFARVDASVADRVRFEIRGVDPDAAVFGPLEIPTVEPGGTRARFAKAAGAGVASSFFVCCVLPIGAIALLGAAAAPLAALDSPGPIAAGAVLSGAATWWWLGRKRANARAGSDSDAGCGC
jgi:hypothetical protein